MYILHFIKMFIAMVLLFFNNQADCRMIVDTGSKNAIMYKVIDEFIGASSAGTHLYFCSRNDATKILKCFTDKHTINSRVLNFKLSSSEIIASFLQPQITDIFLDLTCQSGIQFLVQSSQHFNSSYRWLLWTNNYNQTIDLLNPARILVDSAVTVAVASEDETIVYDLYKMHYSTPFTVTKLELWPATGTSIKLGIPKPRNNFMGTVIKASVVARFLNYSQDNIIELMLDPSYMPGMDAKRRFHLRMFIYLAEHYNFTPSYKFARTWGIPTKNGSFIGMIGQLQRNETEISAVYTIFSVPRSAVIDYVLAVTYAKGSILFLQPQLLGTYKALIVPLQPTVWVAIFVISIITIISFKVVGRCEQLWSDSTLIVVATIAQQGGPDMENMSKRLWHLAALNFAFFITLYYNIAILSGLLLPAPNAIQNMDQLLASNLKFGVETEPYIRNDAESNDELSVRLRAKMAKSKLSNKVYFDSDDGLELVRRGDFAFYNLVTDSYAKIRDKYTEAEVCSLTEIDKFSKTHIGPIVQNDGPYKELFRRSILLMKENGMIKNQFKFWVASKPECIWKQEKFTIGTRALTIAFSVLLIGLFASGIVFILEVRKFRKKRKEVVFYSKELSLLTQKTLPQ